MTGDPASCDEADTWVPGIAATPLPAVRIRTVDFPDETIYGGGSVCRGARLERCDSLEEKLQFARKNHQETGVDPLRGMVACGGSAMWDQQEEEDREHREPAGHLAGGRARELRMPLRIRSTREEEWATSDP
ncbi:hypothetical protein N9060_01680 [Arenicella sp.]|nr:hypothetical protein [Arenicella sp.]